MSHEIRNEWSFLQAGAVKLYNWRIVTSVVQELKLFYVMSLFAMVLIGSCSPFRTGKLPLAYSDLISLGSFEIGDPNNRKRYF